MKPIIYPLDRLPEHVQSVVWVLPLTPAVALTRSLLGGEVSWVTGLYALELLGFSLCSFWLAARFMRRRLIT